MQFPKLNSQSDIDKQLQRAKPREAHLPGLPWAPAVFGLVMIVAIQTLL